MTTEALYQKFKHCNGVSTDTRNISKNSMYFALKGENFDGNTFAKQALDKGANYSIIDDEAFATSPNCILVDDVLKTLQKLAHYHRTQLQYPIIGLTGSNGKTTTKELIYSVLKTQYKVQATQGNLNNHIGVPLTLLGFTTDLDFGIVEMGANHQTEIEFLCEISEPSFGLITNFGKAHMEGFGGVEGIIKGKSELYHFLKANQNTILLNTDDAIQIKQVGTYSNVVTFGTKGDNNCSVTFTSANPYVSLVFNSININSNLIGNYNFYNIAIAIAIGNYYNVTAPNIKSAIENYTPKNNRSQIIKKSSTTIILDAYNANPTSMLAALDNFKTLNANTKYLFLGDMFELGEASETEHQHIIHTAETYFKTNIYCIGEHFYNCKTQHANTFKNFDAFQQAFHNTTISTNSHILIKGSRGMALERILDLL